ncbi:MAG TPA: serine/threonine-protein kinase [Rhodanobacteraceae bacterium]|nr:serine/threonine-protein kinase [Rhodanobacteraceae bacterium]
MIGPYRLLHLLGNGGMGHVWLAEEAHPRRQVALKLARTASPSLIARMQREIRTLAALEHPAIARLYAAGETRLDGVEVPWLAMEYVRGTELIEYVQSAPVAQPACLRLLVDIARAIDFAHRRGVIHRDLKPANILVDEAGAVHILDFGIAWRGDVEDGTLTQLGQVLGTLPYMSPEQLLRGDRGADVRSDVYSLGVVAYEVLSGALPYPQLASASLFEALNILRDEKPVPLTLRTGGIGADLATVVMKAMDADPERRYASAAAFADDLERVLKKRPVLAQPPTPWYRARRFVSRYRVLSIASTLVFLILASATLVSIRYAVGERAARALADQRARESEAISAFLRRMLSASNPEHTAGLSISLDQVVKAAENELDGLTDQPTVQRVVAATLASTHRALGNYTAALTLIDRALALPHPDNAEQRRDLLFERASTLVNLARFDEADRVLDEAALAWPVAPLASQLELDLERSRILLDRGDFTKAEAALRALLARAASADADKPSQNRPLQNTVATIRSTLSTLLREAGRLDEAENLIREVLAWRRQALGERAPLTLTSRHNLALILEAKGDYGKAETELRATLALRREILGEQHLATLTSWQSLANILAHQGKFDEAAKAARISMDGFSKQLGEAHVQTLAAMNSLAYCLEQQHQVDAAETMYRRIIAIQQRTDSRHPSAYAPRNNLAMLLMDAGKLSQAEGEFSRLVEDSRTTVGDDHLMTAIFMSNHGLCLTRMGRLQTARQELEGAHRRLLARVGAKHARTQAVIERLSDVYRQLGDKAALAALRKDTPA